MKKLLLAIALTAATAFAGTASDPVELIKKKDQDLQLLLRKKQRTEKDVENIKYLINDIFDFQLLGKKALPSETWKGLDSANKASFVSEFRRMVENTSVKKLEIYSADSTRFDPADVKNDEAKVTAHVWYKGKESVFVYKLSLVDGKWRAWDLVIDDLSTARNYREQFAKILETKPFSELLATIKKKADGVK